MKPGDGGKPKLPVQQLAILAVARFSEPLALTSVFPYVPEMIESFGVPKNNIARWAGLTSAVFSLAQSAAAVPWGMASDKFGRKPIIIIGLINAMVTFMIWGMSSSLPMAIFCRALQGIGTGNVGIIRTMVAEIVPEKELQPRAFSLMPLIWSLGSVFGPAFGGFFSKPATQFPSVFGNSWFFNQFPFSLPNIILACFFSISFTTAFFWLKETHEMKRHDPDWGRQLGKKITRFFTGHKHHHHHHRHHHAHADDADGEAGPLLYQVTSNASSKMNGPPVRMGPPPPPVKFSELFTSQTQITIACYTLMALHSVSYDQILPVFLNYPLQIPNEHNTRLPFYFSGGFGLSSNRIGTIFAIYGVTCGIVQFTLFPSFCKRFGVLNCYKACTAAFPILYFLTPYTVVIQNTTARYAFFIAIMFFKAFAVMFGFPCVTILFTNSAPDLRVLGTLNGVATTLSGLGRAAGPAIAGASFTWGLDNNYMITSWWILATIAALGAIPVWWIVEQDGPRHPSDSSSEDGDEDEEEGETLVGDGVGSFATVASGFEDDLAVLDEEDDEDEAGGEGRGRETPFLARSLTGGLQQQHSHGHHHAGYSTFGVAHMRMRRMSSEGRDIEHAKGDGEWKVKRGDSDNED